MVSRRSQFLIGTAGTAAGIGVLRSPVRAAEFQWRLAASLQPGTAAINRMVQMADGVKHDTKGRLDITVYPNSQLGSQNAMLGQLRTGAVQLLMSLDISYSGVVPVVAASGVGFAFASAERVYATMDGGLGAYIVKEFAAKNIYCFDRILTGGFRQVTSYPRAIFTVEDLSGFRVRTPAAPIVLDLFRTLGASPTPLDSNEQYTALQTHLIDGQEAQYEYIEALKMYEVTRYLSETNHMWTGHWLTANMEAWNSLPHDLQDAVKRNYNVAMLGERKDTDNAAGPMADKLRRRGMKFNKVNPAPMRAKLGPYYARWKNELGPTVWGILEQFNGKLG